MGSDIVELIKDIVKYLSSGLVEYFLECRVSDKRQEYFSNKGGKWAKFCFYMSLIVSILLIIIGIVGLVKKKSIICRTFSAMVFVAQIKTREFDLYKKIRVVFLTFFIIVFFHINITKKKSGGKRYASKKFSEYLGKT